MLSGPCARCGDSCLGFRKSILSRLIHILPCSRGKCTGSALLKDEDSKIREDTAKETVLGWLAAVVRAGLQVFTLICFHTTDQASDKGEQSSEKMLAS